MVKNNGLDPTKRRTRSETQWEDLTMCTRQIRKALNKLLGLQLLQLANVLNTMANQENLGQSLVDMNQLSSCFWDSFIPCHPFRIITILVMIHRRLEIHICCFLFEIEDVGSLWVKWVGYKIAWSSGKQMSFISFQLQDLCFPFSYKKML